MRLAVVASHPVQYYAPLFRELAGRLDLNVFYCHRDTPADQARAGFGQGFAWDVDLTSGYDAQFLDNVAREPGLGRFGGVDCPGVAEALREGRFDGVLIMGWYLKAFIQALVAARRIGLPALVRGDSHLATPRSSLKRWAKEAAYPMFLRQFAAALVVGTRSREYWQHYRYPEERLFSSPHCIDTQWFAERATPAAAAALRAEVGIPNEAPVVLVAGKLIDLKRPLDVVEALARVRAEGLPLHLLVAGAGPLDKALRARAASLEVPLHSLGFCNQTRMPAAYSAADLLVLASSSETWGLVANEALACGRPIVVSNAVGCAEDLAPDPASAQGSLAGRQFPLGDVAALGAALAATLRAPRADAAIAALSERHSLAAAADGILVALAAVRRPLAMRGMT